MSGVDVTSASTITVQRDDEGLLRVSSVIPIKWEFNVFSCLMRSNTTKPAYQSKVGVYVFSPGISGWSLVFWLSLAFYVAVTIVLILKWRKMKDKNARYKTKVNFFHVWNLLKETEMTQHPGLTLKFSKVIKEFTSEDLTKITEHYKPQLAYVMNLDISSILQSLVTKQILTNEEAQRLKAKEEFERATGVESFISDVMKKNRAVLVGLWEVLAEEFVRFPSPNLRRILEEVTNGGPDFLKEMQASVQSPSVGPHIKDLHEMHRAIVCESTIALKDHASSAVPHSTTGYTELMVIKQNTRTLKETEHELVKTGRTHEELKNKETKKKCERIWTEQIFKRSPGSETSPHIVLVSGVAGIGKTTMIQKVMFDWGGGTQYQRFAFVFLFKFRELNLLDNETEPRMSLTRLIERHYKHLSDSRLTEILQKPESLLLIFDGLDEYKHKLNFTDSQLCSNPDVEVPVHILVTSLVSRTLLKGCSVLITSRPTALEAMDMERVDQFVEILGFLPEQRLTYFKKFFSDTAFGIKAFQYVEEIGILYSMCFSPSYCWMICSVLKSHFMTSKKGRGAAPRTVTEIFMMFLHNILTNYRQEAKYQREILVRLGKMAYNGVDKNIFVFYNNFEMSTFGLQTVVSSSFLYRFLDSQSTPDHSMYTFYQVTLQEFMAACSFYFDPSGDVEELLKYLNLCEDGRFEIVTRFLAGLAWCPVFKALEGILGEFEGKTTQRIQEWVRQKAKQALQWEDQSETLRVCHWLCETQNKELIRDAIGEDLKMNFSSMTLSSVDCAVLASVISCCGELKELNLSETPLTPECIRRLAPGFSCCYVVRLYSCGLTSVCCSALSSVLSSPNSRLTVLYLNNNNLGDSGARQLREGLRSDNCKVETLVLEYNGISESEKRNLRLLQEELRGSGRQLTIYTCEDQQW
uniref:NACHT domain-containing protein n=1 Tax=Erpetoichthys calabaricus TaxID=27687 RepID=A0A8C4TMU5_ERPCA